MSKTLHLAVLTSFVVALVIFATNSWAQTVSGLVPAQPQPAADSLKPGLAVEYLDIMVRHVDEIEIAGKGKPGDPLPLLDWQTGDGEVLTSGRLDGVGARITGFVRFPSPGTYLMATHSNDGIRLKIGGVLIHEDPGVHSDTFSPNIEVVVPEAGWYPLYLLYFERRVTSTLELYWQPPGTDQFVHVPEDSFAHLGH